MIWIAKTEGKKQKYVPFSAGNLRQREKRSSFALARSLRADFEAVLDVGDSAGSSWVDVCDSALGWGKRKIEFNCLNRQGLLLKQLFIIIHSGTISALSALKFPDF